MPSMLQIDPTDEPRVLRAFGAMLLSLGALEGQRTTAVAEDYARPVSSLAPFFTEPSSVEDVRARADRLTDQRVAALLSTMRGDAVPHPAEPEPVTDINPSAVGFGSSPLQPMPEPWASAPPPPLPPAGTVWSGGLVPPPAEDDTPATDVPAVDSRGLPWDERIHASSKARLVSGEWRQRRNTPQSLVDQVEAELRGGQPLHVTAPAAPPPPPPPPPAVGIVLPPPGTRGYPPTFAAMMPLITAGMVQGTINGVRITAACEAAGITGLPELASRPQLIPQICDALGIGL